MKLPGGNTAIVDRAKLTEYCLNPDHPRGKHKARIFATVPGFTAEDADALHSTLLAAAVTADAQRTHSDRFGSRYVIDFEIRGPKGTGMLRSSWIIRHGESTPRLTSCYLK